MAESNLFSGFEPYKLSPVKVSDNKLGHGSYATVVEVTYTGLKCAGKKIHEILLEQGDTSYAIRRFEKECRILSHIRHPNIVQFLGVYFEEGMKVPILVMEYLPMNLTSCIQQHGILPREMSYSILHDVALGLCYLHNQSPPIVHRDLSANNVLLTRDMDAKISDLGVARMINLTPLQASRMTQTPGTPAYMPPEVMVANPKYDTSIDEFSYGIMMIHIFSGKWPEPECSQIRMEDGKMIPVSEAERRQSFLKIIGDHPLLNVIMKCIHNDPRERMHAVEILQHMSEMAAQFPKMYPQVEQQSDVYDDIIVTTASEKAPQEMKPPVKKKPSSLSKTKLLPQSLSEQQKDEPKAEQSGPKTQSPITDTSQKTKAKQPVKKTPSSLSKSKLLPQSPLDFPKREDVQKAEQASGGETISKTASEGGDGPTTTKESARRCSYEEITVNNGKVKIVDSQTKSPLESQPTEQHIYDVYESDHMASMTELEPWYFGHIDSSLARSKCKNDGDYLVRYSTHKQRYIISCRQKDACHHHIVQQLESGEYCVGATASKSLNVLIDYLVTSGIELDSAGTILQNAVSRVDRWAMKRTDLKILHQIGSGGYSGEISTALDKRTNQMVTLRSYAGMNLESLNAFLLDAEVLKRCNQLNVVSLVGVTIEKDPKALLNIVYTVMEHMPGGLFSEYIKNKDIRMRDTQLCRMCIDIAKGLDYLHTKLSRAHCDVAARNCLVGTDENLVKIYNLGKSMSFPNNTELKPIPEQSSLPVRWTAPETYDYQRHLLSDVWSYGILLWEVFSGGSLPYPQLNNMMVISQVKEGYRMDPPTDCPKEISSIMSECWEADPNRRPSFADLISKLQAVHSQQRHQRSNTTLY